MAEQISDEDLRQLLTRTPGGAAPREQAFEQTPVSYDFRSPQPVDSDRKRLIEGVHEQFARGLSATLASSLRMVTEVDLAFSDQVSYSEFVLSLANPCTAYSFMVAPPGIGAVLDLAPALAMAFIDRSFGGTGSGSADEARALTPIETGVVNKLAHQILRDLEAAWESASPIRIDEAVMETNPEFIQVAAGSDPAVLVALEVNAARVSGLVHVCYPLALLESLLPRSPRGESSRRGAGPEHAARTAPSALKNMSVPVVIELARGRLTLEDVAMLQAGDVVKLDTAKGEPAVVYLGNKPKFLGRPGLQGRRRAVQIIRALSEAEEDLRR